MQKMEPSDLKSSQIQSENMSKSQPGYAEEKADQAVETRVRKSKGSEYRTHKFWETQPVVQYKDIGDTSLAEGPIMPATELSEVRQMPYHLPKPYEWTTCDLSSDDVLTEVCNFLQDQYCGEVNNRRSILRKEYLRWTLLTPGYKPRWHVGVRAGTKKKLFAFISGVPAKIRVSGKVVEMARINLICVHKKLRSSGLTSAMIKEVTRRVHLENIWQAVYCSSNVVPTPITTCKNWSRFLDPKKLIEIGFTELGPRSNMGMTIKLYRLPEAPLTRGFRRMEARDVFAVAGLLSRYLSEFRVAADFGYADVAHWLVPREDLVESYVVEDPETAGVITDLCSFSIMTSTILGNPNHTTMRAAYSYCNVATKTPLVDLVKDALIVCKQMECDVYWASDVMHNENFLKELKFVEGEAEGDHYYLYNYRLRSALKPSQLGVI